MTGTALTEARGVRQHLRAGSHRGADQHAGLPPRRGRRGLPDRRGEIQGDRPRHQARPRARASRSWSAPPRSKRSEHAGRSACARTASRISQVLQRPLPRAGGRASSPRPARPAPSPSPPTWPAAAPTSSSAAMPTCASPRNLATMPSRARARGRRRSIRDDMERLKEKAIAAGGLYVLGHRTPREPPHRQPAARPLRPPGRPRPLEVLSCRSQDDLMRIFGSERMDGMLREARPQGGRGDHPSLDQQGAGEGAEEGRGAQLRHPQEPARNTTTSHERPAQGGVRAAYRPDGRRGTCRKPSPRCAETSIADLVAKHIPENAYAGAVGRRRPQGRRAPEILNLDLPIDEWAKEEGIAEEEITERITNAAEAASGMENPRQREEAATVVV